MWLPCGFYYPTGPQHRPCEFKREPGGRGRIRTFVARKERQIYSLLVLATHPPVPVLAIQDLQACLLQAGTNPETRRDAFHVPNHFCLRQLSRNQRKHKTDSCLKTPARLILTSKIRRLIPCRPNQRWSWRRELNPRPSDYKSDALPAELRQPRSNRVRIADGARKLQAG